MIFARQSSAYMIFMEGSSITWKNTSGGSTAFLAAVLASSSVSMFFVLLICSIVNPLK
jgi:hypothetical protein